MKLNLWNFMKFHTMVVYKICTESRFTSSSSMCNDLSSESAKIFQSKAAVSMMVKSLCTECKSNPPETLGLSSYLLGAPHGIRVNALCPGYMKVCVTSIYS